ALRPETAHPLAHALDARGQGDEALMVLEELSRLRPESAVHWTCLGRLLRDRGDRVGASPALERPVAASREAARPDPGDHSTHPQLADSLLVQGKSVEASSEYREVIRLRPATPGAYSNLGVALYQQKKFDEAVAAYREAIRLKPDDADPHCNLGNAL